MIISKKNFLVFLLCVAMMVLAGCKKSSTPNYTVSVTVSGLQGTGMVLQMNYVNSSNQPLAGNIPALANGVVTFLDQLQTNETYTVSVLNPPGSPYQNCTFTNPSGTIAGANVSNITLSCANVGFAYLVNSAANSINPYVIDLSSGSLASSGSPVATGTTPSAFALSSTGRYAYAVNFADSTISAYLGNTVTGLLLSAGGAIGTGSSASQVTNPAGVAVDPLGKFVYVTNSATNSVAGFVINSASAALTCPGGTAGVCPPASIASAGTTPKALAITKSAAGSEYVFVANTVDNTVSEFSINSDGTLAAIGTAPTGNNPTSLAAIPGLGTFVYVTNSNDSTISGYLNNSGSLSANGVTVLPVGSAPAAMAIAPNGKYAYVTCSGSSSVAAFSINASGALISLGALPAGSNNQPVSVSVDASGAYVYVVTQNNNTVWIYTINTDGTLIFSATQNLGNAPVALITSAN